MHIRYGFALLLGGEVKCPSFRLEWGAYSRVGAVYRLEEDREGKYILSYGSARASVLYIDIFPPVFSSSFPSHP